MEKIISKMELKSVHNHQFIKQFIFMRKFIKFKVQNQELNVEIMK